MPVALLLIVVTTWGFSWYAIALQLGTTPIEASVAWRFLLASGLMFLGLAVSGKLRKIPFAAQGWVALLGLFLFSGNFLFIYAATSYVASGVVSVIFACAAIFGSINSLIFLRQIPSLQVVFGSFVGVLGIACLFSVDAQAIGGKDSWIGLALTLAGTYSFSLGNFVSIRVRRDIDLLNGMAWGMLYGGLLTAAISLYRHSALPIDFSATYLGSLVYLAVGASVVAFIAYLNLITRWGPIRASYATVLFPLVALATSTVFEGLVWSLTTGLGVGLALLGAVLVFTAPKARSRKIAA